MEDLRQKRWTLIICILLQCVAADMGATAALLGQGDNQVICLRIPSPDVLEQLAMDRPTYVSNFVTKLGEWSKRAGIIIKTEETWISNHLFEYFRRYHLGGSQVSGGLKRNSRCDTEANQAIPSVDPDLSSTSTTATCAAAEDPHPGPAYVC